MPLTEYLFVFAQVHDEFRIPDTIPQWRQKDVVESFSYMDFKGKIDMKNPDITLVCFEECKPRLMCTFVLITTRFRLCRSRQTGYHTRED